MSAKNDSFFKFVMALFIGMIGLWLMLLLLNNTGLGRMGSGMHFNNGHMGANWQDPSTWNLNVFLVLLLRVFCFLFIVGLVVGIFFAAKEFIFTNGNKTGSKPSISDGASVEVRKVCSKCGKQTGANWKVCAYCGEETSVVLRK